MDSLCAITAVYLALYNSMSHQSCKRGGHVSVFDVIIGMEVTE